MEIYNFVSFDAGYIQCFMVYADSLDNAVSELRKCYKDMEYSFVYITEEDSQAFYDESVMINCEG